METKIMISGRNPLAGLDAGKLQKASIPDDKSADNWEQTYALDRAKQPPTLTLNSKQVPWIEGWEVNKRYKLVVEVQVDSIEETSAGNNDVLCTCRLTVKNLAGMG